MNEIASLIFPWIPVATGALLAWSAYSLWRVSRRHSALVALGLFAVFAVGSGVMSAFPMTYALSSSEVAYTGVLPEVVHGNVVPILHIAFLVGAGSLGLAAARFGTART